MLMEEDGRSISVREYKCGRSAWKDGFNDTEREKEYVWMKESPRNDSFTDESVGARVRLMVRGSKRE